MVRVKRPFRGCVISRDNCLSRSGCGAWGSAERRQGLASYLLDEVVEDLRHSGVNRIEAFPRRGSELDEFELWNGPEALFLRAGFEVVVEIPARPVLALDFRDGGSDDGG